MGVFGTSGIRGFTGKDITPDLVERVVCGFIRVLEGSSKRNGKGRLCVAHDTRASADRFASISSDHIAAHGWDCDTLGVQPAGVICNYIIDAGCDGGVFITGSHLPEGQIGVILLDSSAGYIGGETADLIEKAMKLECNPAKRQPGTITDARSNAYERYTNLVSHLFPAKIEIRISIDPCCGSAAGFASPLMKGVCGVDVFSINDYRSERFPRNPEPRSTSTSALQEYVTVTGSDMGAAYDIDADRVLIIDERGSPVSEDTLGVFLAKHMLRPGDACTAPINSSSLIEKVCREMGVRFEYCGIGQPKIVAKMREIRASYAYEESGKYYVKHQGFACGILTTLAVGEIIASSGRRLSEHIREIPEVFMWKKGFDCPNNAKVMVMKEVSRRWDEIIGETPVDTITLDGVKKVYDDGSWVMIRASGTEPKIRIYLEGKNEKRRDDLASSAGSLVQEALKKSGGNG